MNLSAKKKIPYFITTVIFTILFLSNTSVNAQGNGGGFNGGGNGRIPCRDSTPMCPCVLPNGDCFDIDTPIDNDLKILIVGALLIGIYKLNSIRKLQVNS